MSAAVSLSQAIRIDDEFKALIPAPTPEERTQLEANILAHGGARDALVVWENVLLDGHNRYEICTRLGLPYRREDVGASVSTRDDAKLWIIYNQFGRRNLSKPVRIELALAAKALISRRAKDNQRTSTGGSSPQLRQNSDKADTTTTLKELAKHADTSHDTMHKAEYMLKRAPGPVKQAWREQTLSTDAAYKVTKQYETLSDASRVAVVEAVERRAESATKNESVIDIRPIIKEVRKAERAESLAAIPSDLPRRTDRFTVLHGDLLEAGAAIPDNSVDVIITDPPYPEEFLPVYSKLAKLAARVLKPGGSCIVMIGQSYLPEIVGALSDHLKYQWMLAYLTPGGQATQLWQRKVNTFWKPLLWFVKGEYAGEWVGDVTKSKVNDNDKRFHHWGQSESGMADIVERFSKPGHTVLDPFCGAGTTGVVAVYMSRKFIGIDMDEKHVTTTVGRLSR